MKSYVLMFFLFLSLNLFAQTNLKNTYITKNDSILLSDIEKNVKKDVVLYRFDMYKHSKRVKSRELIEILKKYSGIKYVSKYSYIEFREKSPINTTRLNKAVRELYIKNYPNIIIEKISVHSRSHLTSITQQYEISFRKNSHLSNRGVLYIKTIDNKKIFFNYVINAKIDVYVARKNIKKGEELSKLNLQKESIILSKLRAMPIKNIEKLAQQAKHHISKESLLTTRDTVGLYLIKRGSTVNVSIKDSNIVISFLAKAKQNGRYGEYIYVVSKNGHKSKVLVTGRNTAEIK